MPWKDPDNWIYAKMMLLGFPFMSDGQSPHLNMARIIESVIISLGTAAIIGVVGWMWMIPEMKYNVESQINMIDYKIAVMNQRNKLLHNKANEKNEIIFTEIKEDISEIKQEMKSIKEK